MAVYTDRAVSPANTYARLRPRFAEFGITRVADQTGFDLLGIPTFAAFRPNASTLAVSQGKGLTRDAARTSAFMEALELAVAEKPGIRLFHYEDLGAAERDGTVPQIDHLLPYDAKWSPDQSMAWVKGWSWDRGQTSLVPLDAVDLAPRAQSLKGICKTTNGLASGNTTGEAYFHALCELIERDAESLWSLAGVEEQAKTEVNLSTFDDEALSQLVSRIERAGMPCRLFEITSDIEVPVMACVIPGSSTAPEASGTSCHPDPVRAAIRAVTEAAQSRVTGIAGARDDIEQAWSEPTGSGLSEMPQAQFAATAAVPVATAAPQRGMTELIGHVEECLRQAGIRTVCAFPLSDDPDFAVVKVLAPELEDRAPNVYWRPRARALERLVA